MSRGAFSTRNFIGTKAITGTRGLSGRLRVLSGLGIDTENPSVASALDAGIDPGTISTLQAQGASDGQIEALADGQVDLPTLMEELSPAGLPAVRNTSGASPNYQAGAAFTSAQQAQVNDVANLTGFDPTDDASWYEISGHLQELNTQIRGLEYLAARTPAVRASCGAPIAQLRADYKSIVPSWTKAYQLAFGTNPGGLNGMKGIGLSGITPTVVMGTIPTFLGVCSALHELTDRYETVNARVQSQLIATQAALTAASNGTAARANTHQWFAEMNAAQANGNTARASDLAKQISTLSGMGDDASDDDSGDSLYDFFYNMVHGNISPDQQAQLVAQESDSLIAAGMPANQATTQAQSDVTRTLATVTAPGGLGITWTGAGPTSPGFGTAASSAVTSGLAAVPLWAWIAGGAVVVLLVVKK